MAMDAKTQSTDTQVSPNTPTDPNTHFHQWLTDNDYKVSVEALTENTPFLEGKGFVLTDRPLLVVTINKKENNTHAV